MYSQKTSVFCQQILFIKTTNGLKNNKMIFSYFHNWNFLLNNNKNQIILILVHNCQLFVYLNILAIILSIFYNIYATFLMWVDLLYRDLRTIYYYIISIVSFEWVMHIQYHRCVYVHAMNFLLSFMENAH